MDVAAIAMAIAALLMTALLAGFGILIQFKTHKATTEQAERIASSVGQFRADMQGLLGELKGMTDTLVDAQQQQFNRMLDAFVTRPGTAAEVAESATRSAASVEELRAMLEGLRAEVEKAADADSVLARLQGLEARLDEVRDSTVAAARLAERASARGADWAVREPSVRRTSVGGPPRPVLVRLRVSAREIRPGGSVTLEPLGWLPVGEMHHLTCIVRLPSGGTAAVGLKPDMKWGARPRVMYPGDFLNSSTDEEGEYVVTLRSPRGATVAQNSFVVVPEGRRP